MEYRILGNSNVKVSAITFGAWAIGGWMWGGTDISESKNAILASLDLGVTTFDTAPIYGYGLSEEIIADAFKGIARDKYQILTKCGLIWQAQLGTFYFDSKDGQGNKTAIYKYSGKESIIRECEASLRRLHTDYIDLFQIHWPDESTPIEEAMEALNQLQKQGKIRAAGVSNYNYDQLRQASCSIDLASIQSPYSMVNKGIEDTIIPYCLEHNIGVLAYSPLQRGLLTGKFTKNHHFNKDDHRADSKFFAPENVEKTNLFLDLLRPIANQKEVTLSQLVIAWTIKQPGVTAALVGARNKEQATLNAQSINLNLTAHDIEEINTHLYALRLSTI